MQCLALEQLFNISTIAQHSTSTCPSDEGGICIVTFMLTIASDRLDTIAMSPPDSLGTCLTYHQFLSELYNIILQKHCHFFEAFTTKFSASLIRVQRALK